MVIETHGSNRDHDQEKLELFLEYLMENEMIVNGTVAEDSKKVGEIWQLRERMAEALQHDGYVYKVCTILAIGFESENGFSMTSQYH